MRKLLWVVLLVWPQLASAEVIFVGDFETGDHSCFPNCWPHFNPSGNAPTLVQQEGSVTPRAGDWMMHTYLNRLTSPVNYRTETRPVWNRDPRVDPDAPGDSNFRIGGEYWIAASIFLPDEYEADGVWETVLQYHGVPDFELGEDWRNPVSALWTSGGEWSVGLKWDSKANTFESGQREYEGGRTWSLGPYETGRWTDWAFHVKWSYESDGIFQVYKDGVLVIDHLGPNCFNDALGPYLKMGIYKGWKTGLFDVVDERLLYHDEVRIGDAESSLLEVSPPSETTPTCAAEGGTCCADTDQCLDGSVVISSDCATACCVGGTCTQPQSCADLGGACCAGGQVCQGGVWIASDDCGSACCSGGTCAQPPDGIYVATRASAPPVIDGACDEYAAADAIDALASTNSQATGWLLWDDDGLYLCVDVADLEIFAEQDRDGALWSDDSVAILLDRLHDGGASYSLLDDDYRIFVSATNVQRDDRGATEDWDASFTSATTVQGTANVAGDADTGYTVELALPWAELGTTAPAPGTTWGMDLLLNDPEDPDGVVSSYGYWHNVDGGTGNNPDGWGDIVFVNTGGDPLCIESATQSCYTGALDTEGVGACAAGAQTCAGGEWSTCAGEVVPAPEVCDDGADNDCDGATDADDPQCGNCDADGDGHNRAACGGADCDDADALIHPDSPELCGDGIDNDCSGGPELPADCPVLVEASGCGCNGGAQAVWWILGPAFIWRRRGRAHGLQ